MAIGDAVCLLMGTGVTNYQPSAGVEVMITFVVTTHTTGANDLHYYDGSNDDDIIRPSTSTSLPHADNSQISHNVYNTRLGVTNSLYLRKLGTAEYAGVSGVQTGA
jgi:hypothetical protein